MKIFVQVPAQDKAYRLIYRFTVDVELLDHKTWVLSACFGISILPGQKIKLMLQAS